MNVQSAALAQMGGRVLSPLDMLDLQARQLAQQLEQQKAAQAAQAAAAQQQAQVTSPGDHDAQLLCAVSFQTAPKTLLLMV